MDFELDSDGTNAKLRAIHVAEDGRHGWVVGSRGTILATTDGGATWTAQTSGTDAFLYAIHVTDDGRHGLAVGSDGTIVVMKQQKN